jgi:hypothetical protein
MEIEFDNKGNENPQDCMLVEDGFVWFEEYVTRSCNKSFARISMLFVVTTVVY